MWTMFFSIFLIGILAVSICYIAGKTVISFYPNKFNTFFKLFLTYIIGFIVIILLYSILKSGGRTINILLIPFILFFIYHFRTTFNKHLRINWNEITYELSWSYLLFTLIFIYQSWFFFDFTNNEVKALFCDFYAYANFTNSLQLWGAENYLTSLNYFSPHNRFILAPYHYPELWLTSFFSQTFSISTLKTYYLIIFPILTMTYAIGIMQLFEDFIPRKYLLIPTLFLLFSSSIIFTYPSQICIMGHLGIKLAFMYNFGLLSLYLYYKNYHLYSLVILMCLPIFSITFLPGVIGGIIVFSLSKILKNKFQNYKQEIIIASLSSLVIIAIALIYLLISKTSNTSKNGLSIFFSSPIFVPLKSGISFSSIKVTLLNLIYYSFESFKFHALPIILGIIPIFIITIKENFKIKSLWILCLFMFICGSIVSRLIWFNSNSFQFTTNIGLFLPILTSIAISIFLRNYNLRRTSIGGLKITIIACLILFYSTIPVVKDMNSYSYRFKDFSFMTSVSQEITNKTAVILTFIKPSYNLAFGETTSGDEIFALNQICDKRIIYSLGNPELSLSNKNITSKQLDFYNKNIPIVLWRNNNSNKSLKLFIDQFHLKYFYFSSGIEIPPFIEQNAVIKIISPINHNVFIKMR